MFATLFLGAILAVFLTLNVIRGDAEAGLLQPLVVRAGRPRALAARAVSSARPAWLRCMSSGCTPRRSQSRTGRVAGLPTRVVTPGLELAGAIVVVSALALAGSVFFAPIANGIGTLMVFGAGLIAGLLGEIGHAIQSQRLQHIARLAWWVFPVRCALRGLAESPHRRHDRLRRVRAEARAVWRIAPRGHTPPHVGRRLLLLVVAAAVAAFSARDL